MASKNTKLACACRILYNQAEMSRFRQKGAEECRVKPETDSRLIRKRT